MKETLNGFEHGYVNDAIHCSSIDITNPETTPHGHLRGSNEFIRESCEDFESKEFFYNFFIL